MEKNAKKEITIEDIKKAHAILKKADEKIGYKLDRHYKKLYEYIDSTT